MLIVILYFDFILFNSDFDFILYYNLLLYFIPLEMHARLICAIKFYLLTYLMLSPQNSVGVCLIVFIEAEQVLSESF